MPAARSAFLMALGLLLCLCAACGDDQEDKAGAGAPGPSPGGPGAMSRSASGDGFAMMRTSYKDVESTFHLWPDKTVRWAYAPGGAPAVLSNPGRVLALIAEAAAQWEAVADIRFVQSSAGEAADFDDGVVVVGWGMVPSSGLAHMRADGSPATVERLGYAPFTDGRVDIRPDEYAAAPAGTDKPAHYAERRYVNTVAHELGHVLGLGHLPDPQSVMFAQPYNNLNYPREPDHAFVTAMYGPAPAPAPPPRYRAPAPAAPARHGQVTRAYYSLSKSPQAPEDPPRVIERVSAASVPDGADVVWLHTEYEGVTAPLEIVRTDPTGVFHSGFAMPAPTANRGMAYVSLAPAEVLMTAPGGWGMFVISQGRTLYRGRLPVISSPGFNHPPEARLALSASSGPAPLTVRAYATVTDPEGDPVDIIWHAPGHGMAKDAAPGSTQSGKTERDFTFTQPGTYAIHIEANDRVPTAGRPDMGFRAVARAVVRVQ